jgi:hypothetical protein
MLAKAFLDNTLRFRVFCDVSRGEVEFERLECDRLPWVATDRANVVNPLRIQCRDGVVAALNKRLSVGEVARAAVTTANNIKSELQDFGVFCDVCLELVLREQQDGAIDSILPDMPEVSGLATKAAQIDLLGTPCEVRRLADIAITNSREIDASNFRISQDGPLTLIPGRGFCFRLTSQSPVVIEGLRVTAGGMHLVEFPWRCQFEAKQTVVVTLPGVPAIAFPLLAHSGIETLDIEVAVGKEPSRHVVVTGGLSIEHVVLPKGATTLFLDLGSAVTKVFTVECALPVSEPAELGSAVRDAVATALAAAVDGDAERVELHPLLPTRLFEQRYGLPHVPKEILNKRSDEEVASHLSRIASGLAAHFYFARKLLVSDIYLAFPNTRGRDFTHLESTATASAGKPILNGIHLVPESECLRWAFGAALPALATAAKSAIERHRRATERNEAAAEQNRQKQSAYDEYMAQSAVWRWAKYIVLMSPEDPEACKVAIQRLPTLKEWHAEFARVHCDEQLSEYLILDAGGYSLDVFGRFVGLEDVSSSYEAGSLQLNEPIVHQLMAKMPGRPAAELQEIAEQIKCSVCRDSNQARQHPLYETCVSATKDVYEAPLDAIFSAIAKRKRTTGFPIILSGGGSDNSFLRDLVRKKAAMLDAEVVPVTSFAIYRALQSAKEISKSDVQLFRCMASAFRPHEEIPSMVPASDIVGGLAQLALDRT